MERFSIQLAILVFASSAAAQERNAVNRYEINCETATTSVDGESSAGVCIGADIIFGDYRISAGSAMAQRVTELIGSWTFSESVRFAFGTAEVLASEARLEFVSGELRYAELIGSPVTLSDYIEETETPVSGESDSIIYDSESSTLRLTGETTFVRGSNRHVGCDWIYNFENNSFRAGTTECGIQITVAAPEDSEASEAQPEAP